MMRDFFKFHSLGNDFVLIDWFKKTEWYLQSILNHESWTEWVRSVCARNTGVGADGILIIRGNTEFGVPEVLVYNADGSEGQTCLNGLRTVAHYMVVYKNLPASLSIRMGQRLYECIVAPAEESCHTQQARIVTMSMDPAQIFGQHELMIEKEVFSGIRASIGNPHYLCMRSVDLSFLRTFGPLIESHPDFPERTNVDFLWQDCSREDLFHLLVYERGCGITSACSSAAATAASVLYARGIVKDEIDFSIKMLGGELQSWVRQNKIYLRAPSVEVFSGMLTHEAHIR